MKKIFTLTVALISSGCAFHVPISRDETVGGYIDEALRNEGLYTPVHAEAAARACALDYLTLVQMWGSARGLAPRLIEREAWVYMNEDASEYIRVARPRQGAEAVLSVRGVKFMKKGDVILCFLGGEGAFAGCSVVYFLRGDEAKPVILDRHIFNTM